MVPADSPPPRPVHDRRGADRGGPNPGLSLHEKIDVCRGVFAALVVVVHALEIAWGTHEGARERLPEFARAAVVAVFGSGTYYVMGFFVLSGYCIHLSVARSIEGGRFAVKRYTAARLSRVLPLYYLALFCTVAVELAIAGARPHEWPKGINPGVFVAQLLMVQNLSQTFGSFASSWSITNEVFYYLLYGLLACAAAGRPARPAWVGMGVCVVTAGVMQALYVTVARTPYVNGAGMLLGLGSLWFLGALVAVHGRAWIERPWVRASARAWPAVLAAAFAWKIFRLPSPGISLMISGLAFALMLLSFLDGPAAEPPVGAGRWRSGVVTTLGLSSYPMYLFHGPLLMLVGSWVMRTGAVADWRATWLLLVAVGWVSGAALGWLLERPTMAWRAAILRRSTEGPPRGAPDRPTAVVRPAPLRLGGNS